jgi:hypothetical protein
MIRHLKLVSGEELLCDVVDDDGESDEIAIRHALKIVSKIQNGYKYYTFKSFMVFQDNPNAFTIIRDGAIIGYAEPPSDLIIEYKKALKEMYELKEENSYNETEHTFKGDSDTSNVVPFKPTHH